MKILLFCTAYNDEFNWYEKYSYWLKHHTNNNIIFTKSLVVDDGSKTLIKYKDIPDTTILYENMQYENEPITNHIIYHFKTKLGRVSINNYPGWYRSFAYAISYAKNFQYDKIIHIESDAYIISTNLVEYINKLNNNWITLFTPKYHIAETAIQVISGQHYIDNAYDILNKPYMQYANKPADTQIAEDSWLRYTINQDFKGDRWGETMSPIPDDADYACQINIINYNRQNLSWFLK